MKISLELGRGPDLDEVRGLPLPRLALEVMIAGGHNLLLHGPHGAGKSMLARRIPSLMPELGRDASIEVTQIHADARRRIPHTRITRPPLRMPHHTVSTVGLLGGGHPPRLGEISLAHRGVLVLDELREFSRACIEGLIGPLKCGGVTFLRENRAVHFPARFQLMATMLSCPCGYLGHPERVCIDSPAAVQRYQAKVFEGPLMDHFDLVVPITPLTADEFVGSAPGESSAAVLERILVARERQHDRLRDTPWTNYAALPAEEVERVLPTTFTANKLLLQLSQRGHDSAVQLRRVARTVQDLDPRIDPRKKIGVPAVAMAGRLRYS